MGAKLTSDDLKKFVLSNEQAVSILLANVDDTEISDEQFRQIFRDVLKVTNHSYRDWTYDDNFEDHVVVDEYEEGKVNKAKVALPRR